MCDPSTTHGRAITHFCVARRQCVNWQVRAPKLLSTMYKSSCIKVWSTPTKKSLSDLWYYQTTLLLLVIYQMLQRTAFILCNTSVSYPEETLFKPRLNRRLRFFSFLSQSKGKFWDRTPNYNMATSSMSLLVTYSLYTLLQVTPQCQWDLYSSGMLRSMYW